VLGSDKPEQRDYKHDLRSLRRHIEAKGEVKKSKRVEGVSEPVNYKRENKPNRQSDEHQLFGSLPMFFSPGSICTHTSPLNIK